jgi:excisionase family DNA binding protein
MTEEYLKQLLTEAVASATIQPELLKLKDVASMLSVSSPTAYRLVNAGEIPFVLVCGNMKRYRRKDVLAYVDRLETKRGGEGNEENAVQAKAVGA